MKLKPGFFAFVFLTVAMAAMPGAGWASMKDAVPSDNTGQPLSDPRLSKRTSLDLRDINISEAVKYLGDKAGMNVAVGKNVQGRANITLKNVSVRDALDIVLLSNDLAVELRGEIIYVMTAKEYEDLHGEKWADPRRVNVFKISYARPTDVLAVLSTLKSKVGNVIADNDSGTVVIMDSPEKIGQMRAAILSMDQESATKVFTLKYTSAKMIEAAIQSLIDGKGIGSVKADEKTNKIIVTTLSSRMSEIEKIIGDLDKKTMQVLIESKIAKVTLSPGHEMGVDWRAIVNEGRKGALDISMKFPVASTVADYGKIVTGVGDYSGTIKLLETMGETKILSSPRIVAVQNQEANIMVGTREAYVTQAVTQGTTTSTTADSVTFIDVGVKLHVTPLINDDGFITMKIRPEVSQVSSTLTTYNADGTIRTQVPIVSTTNADTTVVVKDGNTVIIGGLMENSEKNNSEKMPWFGDLPLLGNAFKKIHKEADKTELVVFLTPHIISGDQEQDDWDRKEIKGLRS